MARIAQQFHWPRCNITMTETPFGLHHVFSNVGHREFLLPFPPSSRRSDLLKLTAHFAAGQSSQQKQNYLSLVTVLQTDFLPRPLAAHGAASHTFSIDSHTEWLSKHTFLFTSRPGPLPRPRPFLFHTKVHFGLRLISSGWNTDLPLGRRVIRLCRPCDVYSFEKWVTQRIVVPHGSNSNPIAKYCICFWAENFDQQIAFHVNLTFVRPCVNHVYAHWVTTC